MVEQASSAEVSSALRSETIRPEASTMSVIHNYLSDNGFVDGPSYSHKDVITLRDKDSGQWIIKNKSDHWVSYIAFEKQGTRPTLRGLLESQETLKLGQDYGEPEVAVGPTAAYHAGLRVRSENNQWLVENTLRTPLWCHVKLVCKTEDEEEYTHINLFSGTLGPKSTSPITIHYQFPPKESGLLDHFQLYTKVTSDSPSNP
ncbi:hypothetical protein PSHT_00559 [Puccinia striiformis]|uniref:Uncharacterized protein n=1 Tax=Puccinia striiformis TaxID=27350 RepID=A0A2S4WMX2_9BASI|nr:hypothetical protein PSHT_00559 [Puccinia striiformis]